MPQALTGVAQLAGHYPTKQKVTDLIAVRAHAWDGVRSPVRARTRGNRSMPLSLTSMFLSFPSPLSKNNKIFKKKRSLESYLRNPKQICQTRDIKRISGDETASHRYYRHCFCPKNEDCRAQTRLGKKHPANVARAWCFIKFFNYNLTGVAQWIEWGLQTKGSPVWLPVRAQAWVAGHVPSRGCAGGSHTLMFLSFSFSFCSLLSKNKQVKFFRNFS